MAVSLIFKAMRDQYIRSGQGFVIVYSITSRSSFENLNSFHDQILRVKDEDSFPVVILANKCDLEKVQPYKETKAQ